MIVGKKRLEDISTDQTMQKHYQNYSIKQELMLDNKVKEQAFTGKDTVVHPMNLYGQPTPVQKEIIYGRNIHY